MTRSGQNGPRFGAFNEVGVTQWEVSQPETTLWIHTVTEFTGCGTPRFRAGR